jgi:hypothetical protein
MTDNAKMIENSVFVKRNQARGLKFNDLLNLLKEGLEISKRSDTLFLKFRIFDMK